MTNIKIGTTQVDLDIKAKKFKSGKNGYYGRVIATIDGKRMVVQIMAYEYKGKS